MRITRKGYYEVYAPDGTYISRHTSRDESYEAITEHGHAGIYRITCPDREIEVPIILATPGSPPGGSDAVFSYSFDSAADQADPEGTGGSAEVLAGRATTTTYRDDGTWNTSNDSYLRVSQFLSATGQQDAGIYINLYSIGLADTTSYSIGWISRHGSDWFDSLVGIPKMIFVEVTADGANRNHGVTPIHSEMPSEPLGTKVGGQLSSNPGTANWVTEAGAGIAPGDGDSLVYDYLARAGEWVYYEITHDHGTQLTFSVYTRDGVVSSQDLLSTTSLSTASDELLSFRFVAYVDFDGTGSVNSYIDISDLYVDNSFMGPPAGFVL